MNTIELSELNPKYEVKVGDQMSYAVGIHGSVGIEANLSIENTEVVKEVDRKFEYDNPSKSDMPGGDGGVRTHTFEAMSIGTTILKVQLEFRGEATNIYNIEIKVTE